jgi:hypothetical protein
MEYSFITKVIYKIRYLLLLVVVFGFTFCGDDPQIWKVKSQEQLAGDYIANNPDDYSEFEKLMDGTGMKSLLNVRGPFTVFLPNNDAMFAYYKLKNVNSLDDFSDSFKSDLIRNHVINNGIPTGDFGFRCAQGNKRVRRLCCYRI